MLFLFQHSCKVNFIAAFHGLRVTQVLMQLSEMTPAQAASVASIAGPLVSIAELAFIVRQILAQYLLQLQSPRHADLTLWIVASHCRIVMTWYPNIKDDEFPWSIAYRPTEPLLAPTRLLIPPVGCVPRSPRLLISAVRPITTPPHTVLAVVWTSRQLCGLRSSPS